MTHNVVLLGSDINAYYMARCYYELFNEPVDMIAAEKIRFTEFSSIVNIQYHPDLKNEEGFVETLIEYGKAHLDKGRTLVIPCHDVYVDLLLRKANLLTSYFVFNCPSFEIADSFLDKEKFYKKYAGGKLKFARTEYYDCSLEETAPIPVDIFYPLIIKPGDAIEYYRHPFPGQPKVFKATTPDNAVNFINKVKASGYRGTLLVQEFIQGDDTNLFDSIFYCNKKGKAELATFAQIGLQEHSPSAIGNATVLINGYNQYGGTEEIIQELKEFLENLGYTGFCEFDLKYDNRDKTFKVMEINPRQARSSYYLAALGHNLIEYLYNDVFENEEREFTLLKDEYLLTMVPKCIVRKYIFNTEYKKKALKLWRKHKKCDPLRFSKEKSVKHKLFLMLRAYRYRQKYRKFANTI